MFLQMSHILILKENFKYKSAAYPPVLTVHVYKSEIYVHVADYYNPTYLYSK